MPVKTFPITKTLTVEARPYLHPPFLIAQAGTREWQEERHTITVALTEVLPLAATLTQATIWLTTKLLKEGSTP